MLTGIIVILFFNAYSWFADAGMGGVGQVSEVWHAVLLERTQHVVTQNSRSPAGQSMLRLLRNNSNVLFLQMRSLV